MTATKVKRSQIKTFLDVSGLADGSEYELLGDGVVAGKISMNPKVTNETYINQDNASITVDSYAPTMSIEQVAKVGDAVFDFIDGLRINRAVLEAAETVICNVWLYDADGAPGAYIAEEQAVSVQIDDFGGEGGSPARINYTINYIGDPVPGTFDEDDSTFTPD
jgi:hypothetical protein